MGIFTGPDFERAEKEGRFVVKNRLPFGTASIDIRVKKLFRQSRILLPPFDNPEAIIDESTERFLESLIEVPLEKDGEDNYWLLKPDEFYFFLAEEEVFKRKEEYLSANIITRSSWARFGVRTQETDDKFTYVNREFDDKIVGSMKTSGTYVKLRPGDSPCQMIAEDFDSPVLMEELVKLIARDRFRIVRDGKEALDFDLKYTPIKGITLTLDRKIKMYNGRVIDPRDPVDEHFDEIILDEKGISGREGDFFISSSAEWISICSCYMGWVWHNKYLESVFGINPMYTHPNAPMVHPRRIFEGKITLEHHPWVNGYHLKPGMPIAHLNLRRLESPLWHGKESRYKGQDEATLCRDVA